MISAVLITLPLLACARKAETELKELHRRYMEASIRHDIKALQEMTAEDIMWKLGERTFVGREQALGPNEFDAGMQTEFEYSNVVVKGNAVEFELIERSDLIRAAGMKELRHYPRFVFENGLVKRKESWKDSSDLKELRSRTAPLLEWIRKKHPEALAKLADSGGNAIYNQENGALARKLANEWVASKAR
jgi:ketosteroid isomerase-like protein